MPLKPYLTQVMGQNLCVLHNGETEEFQVHISFHSCGHRFVFEEVSFNSTAFLKCDTFYWKS